MVHSPGHRRPDVISETTATVAERGHPHSGGVSVWAGEWPGARSGTLSNEVGVPSRLATAPGGQPFEAQALASDSPHSETTSLGSTVVE